MQHSIRFYFHHLISVSPHKIIEKFVSKAISQAKTYCSRKRDQRSPSFLLEEIVPCRSLNHLFDELPHDIFSSDWDWLNGVTWHYLSHRFDLLGSGWVRVYHGRRCYGMEGNRFEMGAEVKADHDGCWLEGRTNFANLAEAQRIWNLVDEDYIPIDWQLDFKSGFRWREDTWYQDIQYGHILGVDIKMPWELARMQHLPQLAWAYALAQCGRKEFDEPEHYVREFRNQVLDFIATNPPRWGVNWKCTMDVAIRVANWLIAYDLLKSFGAQFDKAFEDVFFRSVYEHGAHIIENLEWSPNLRSNHYLSDIVGLLFASIYLPCNRETNAWLAFAVQELVKEVKNQFYEDGGNFEASTSYHRFSAELVSYATALVLGISDEKRRALQIYDHHTIRCLPRLAPAPLPFYPLPGSNGSSPFPEWYFLRMERMAEFTMHITKFSGHIPQIGDNDSGRFLKLFPVYKKMKVGDAKECFSNLKNYTELTNNEIYWMEDFLDHHHLVAAINGLFSRADFDAFVSDAARRESKIIEILSRDTKSVSAASIVEKKMTTEISQIGTLSDWQRFETLFSESTPFPIITRFTANRACLRDGLETIAYPNFGLYLFRSKHLYLSIRCGSIGQNGNGGHAHNDQLSIELEINGKAVIVDPGTYVYTPIPDQRNAYRSVRAHFSPRMENKEPGDISGGMFVIDGDPQAAVIYFGVQGFVGRHDGYGSPVYRRITIEDASVAIADFAPSKELTQDAYEKLSFSPAYGILAQ